LAKRQEWAVVTTPSVSLGSSRAETWCAPWNAKTAIGAIDIDLGSRRLIVTHADECWKNATAKMIANDIGRLPVGIAPTDAAPRLLGRAGVMAVWMHAPARSRRATRFG